MNTYLEDDQQLDKVYRYLEKLYANAEATSSGLRKLKFIDRVSFILDVLLPEVSYYIYIFLVKCIIQYVFKYVLFRISRLDKQMLVPLL